MNHIATILFALLCTVLFPTFICDTSLQFSNSVFPIIFLVGLYALLRYSFRQNYSFRLKVYTHLLGFLFSAMTAYGYTLEYQYAIDFSNIYLILSILVFTHVYAQLLCFAWTFFEKAEFLLSQEDYSPSFRKADHLLTKLFQNPYILIGILLTFWLPCYIATFPGGFKYDASAEFNQLSSGFSGDFPLLHSFLITKLLSVCHTLTGSYNTGIALYTIVQMLLLSSLFADILHTFYKQQVNRVLLGVLLVFYAAFPVIHLLVTTTVRDVLFSGLLTYCIFLFYLMCSNFESFTRSSWKVLRLALILVLTLLSRNNGSGLLMPILLVLISIVVWCMSGKENSNTAAVFCLTAFSSYLILSVALTHYCQPLTPARTNSPLSLFSQSIVRTYLDTGENWSQKEQEEFAHFVNSKNLSYVSENGDSTKTKLCFPEHEMDDFLLFWAKIGLQYPESYLNAILANTRQMWFPSAIVDGYQENGIESYAVYDKCYFSFSDKIAAPGVHMQYFPTVREFYRNISSMLSFEKIPLISMLFSIGFHFWFVLNCVFYAEYRKCHHLRLPLFLLLGYALISAFVPLVLLRYFAALFFAFPMILVFLLQPHTPNVKKTVCDT